MVFQSYALYPHKTVFENIAYPLIVRKRAPDQCARGLDASCHAHGPPLGLAAITFWPLVANLQIAPFLPSRRCRLVYTAVPATNRQHHDIWRCLVVADQVNQPITDAAKFDFVAVDKRRTEGRTRDPRRN